MKYLLSILILLLSIFAFSNSNNFENKFKEANDLYNHNKYEEALDLYNQIISANFTSPNLFYNTANTYYRLNKVGESVYYYEKALQLSPDNEDFKYNLDLVNLRVKNKPAILPTNVIVSFFKQIISFFSASFWAYFSLFLFVLFLILFFFYIKSISSKQKKIYFAISVLVLLFSLVSMFFMQYQISVLNSHNVAIVIDNEIDAKSSPSEKANLLFKVYEGYKVEIENVNGDWAEIKLTDGKKAWVKNDFLKVL